MRILAIPDVRTRLESVMEYVDSHTPGEVGVMDAVFRDAVSYVDPASFAVLVEWWARFDPAAALNSLNSRFYGDQRSRLVAMVLQQWARADPESAKQALELVFALGTPPSDFTGDTYRTALAWGWAESGRDGYWEFVEALPTGMTRQRALSAVATWMLAREGVDATLAFAKSLNPSGRQSLKLQFHRKAAAALARRDPRRAAEWSLEMFDSPFGEGMLNHVAGEWGRQDGQAALEWMLENLPAGDSSEDAIHQAYLRWVRFQRNAALRWLEEVTPGSSLLAPAYALYIRAVGFQDPEAAADWLQYLEGSEEYRDRTTTFVAQRWLAVDPERAREWMDEVDLDPELYEEASSPIDPRGKNSAASPPEN